MNRLAPQLAFVTIVAAAGCKHTEPNYCEDVPVTHNCLDKIDADTSCSSNAQCSGTAPVCDVGGSKMCVQCTTEDETACSGATPVCGADNTCERCTMHAQCSSSVCLPDGSCSDGGNVAYVAANGSGSACTKAMPCGTLATAIGTSKPIVKIAAGLVKDTTTTTIDGKAVTILADPGAKLDRDGDGPILEVRSANADVKIYDLEVTGASGVSGADGIQLTPNGGAPKLTLTRVNVTGNQGGGITASGGTLVVSQSTVSGNAGGGIACSGGALTVSQSIVSTNQGGGIAVMGTGATFDVTNNYVFRNGDPDNGTFGGVNLGIATAGGNRFEFNTVVDNRASAGATRVGGVLCDIAAFAAANNIVARNSVGGSTTGTNAQTLGGCTYPTSKIQNDVSGLALASPDMAPYSYKLTTGSSAIDQATTSSPIVVDYDGDVRPQGPQKDIGADELK